MPLYQSCFEVEAALVAGHRFGQVVGLGAEFPQPLEKRRPRGRGFGIVGGGGPRSHYLAGFKRRAASGVGSLALGGERQLLHDEGVVLGAAAALLEVAAAGRWERLGGLVAGRATS